jgi:ribosomal protein L10
MHGLSRRAHQAAADKKLKVELDPLLSGPLAVVAFPAVSPQHLKVALSILSPSSDFPAPRRKAQPSYHEPSVQAGLQKLMLLGARVEGKVFDQEGTKWVGSIPGGIDGLRAQLVAMLQNVGAGITNTLESAGRSLYFTMEGRKGMLEDEQKEEKTEKGQQ